MDESRGSKLDLCLLLPNREWLMRRIHKPALIAVVWLTIVAVTADGFPRVQCRCPDGQVQFLCLGLLKSSRSCCIKGCCSGAPGGCCRARRAAPAEVSCGHCADHATSTPSKSGTVQATKCVKSMLASDSIAVSGDVAGAQEHVSRIALLPVPPLVIDTGVLGTVAHNSSPHLTFTPETDLVTVLQRLVI
jgi:hypothetical protein